ncbi:hypothetical protein SORBI_3003G258000 [Sorghum bicolor]|uniref:O-acyltransferase WSD1 C-terminal domain-containing protein n=1 Tax=Sorghum bicolor TaxID=4558 RepID=C5XGR3_SORBI|nr:hypothetical protein SORBI_3003G258000 [Sorghum bicolor]
MGKQAGLHANPLPFHLAKHDDPIEYVRTATKVARRKKSSMESVFTSPSGAGTWFSNFSASRVYYMNSVKLVLSVDEAQFPDRHQFLDDFAESLRLIRKAASGKPGETQDAASS